MRVLAELCDALMRLNCNLTLLSAGFVRSVLGPAAPQKDTSVATDGCGGTRALVRVAISARLHNAIVSRSARAAEATPSEDRQRVHTSSSQQQHADTRGSPSASEEQRQPKDNSHI